VPVEQSVEQDMMQRQRANELMQEEWSVSQQQESEEEYQ